MLPQLFSGRGSIHDSTRRVQSERKEHLVCRLKHSLYGLKQAPRYWNMTLDHLLRNMGFEQTKSDPCLYISSEGELCIIAVYIDDILLNIKQEKNEGCKKQIICSV